MAIIRKKKLDWDVIFGSGYTGTISFLGDTFLRYITFNETKDRARFYLGNVIV